MLRVACIPVRTIALLAVLSFPVLPGATHAAPRALFDNLHAETAGNADWIVDTHQPVPVPAPATVSWATPETYWTGAVSAWGIQLAKRGYDIATLGAGTGITYGNAGNTYDLSKFDVFVVVEPNTRFSAAESTAIFNFVRDGGGLIAVSDHYLSDRDNDGWDSPRIWNALDSQLLWGVHCGVAADANNNIVQTSFNVSTAPSDSVIHGGAGDATSIAFHNGTTFTLYPGINPSVRGNLWMTGLPQGSTSGAMVAQSVYGNGRVVYVGDSSPADDGTGQPGNSLFFGWNESGGSDSVIILNATLWATRRALQTDNTPPQVTLNAPGAGASWGTGTTQQIQWTASDDVGVTLVSLEYSADDGASWSPIASGPNSGGFPWSIPLTPTVDARVRCTARDAASNSAVAVSPRFTVVDVTPPVVGLIEPQGGEAWNTGSTQTVLWSAGDNGVVDTVNLDYSAHGAPGPWLAVAHGLANTGAYDWTLPLEPSDSALARVTVFDAAGNSGVATSLALFRIVFAPTAVGSTPRAFALAPPYPLPSSGPVTLRFTLPTPGRARLDLTDVTGRRVWGSARVGPGSFAVVWDGGDAGGMSCAPGLYFARLSGPWGVRTVRVLRLR